MRLTIKDWSATALTAAIIGISIAYRVDTGGWIISSTRATIALTAVLGIAACALGRSEDLYASDRSLNTAELAVWDSMLGIIASIAVIVGVTTGDPAALFALVATTVVLWLTATVRHLLTAPHGGTSNTADVREPPVPQPATPADADRIAHRTTLPPAPPR